MIMVIFGAGASYDSCPTFPSLGVDSYQNKRIPLANQLFEKRELSDRVISRFPQIRPIIPYLQQSGKKPIEQILQELLDEGESDPKRFQQVAAVRYYLHMMIWESELEWLNITNQITNHITLLDQLRKRENEGICLVTFNYDRLIENALRSIDITINKLSDYISNDKYTLIKLHGSVDWARITTLIFEPHVSEDTAIDEMIRHGKNIKFIPEDIYIVNKYPMSFIQKQKIPRYGLYPAIAIPIERKDNYECPVNHLNYLMKKIPQVNKILIIGWRATESYFLKLLSENLDPSKTIRCAIVSESTSSVNETINNLKTVGQNINFGGYGSGFSDFVLKKQVVTEFLN